MPFILRDRVRETTSTSGTGAIFPSGVVTGGYRTFNSQLANGDTTLCLVRNNAGQWQTFLGTWNSATQSMARTTVYDGSEGAGVTVNFSGEQQEIWINYPAEKYEHPQVQDINIGAPYGVNTGARLFTIYKDQSLSASSPMVFRVGGIARGGFTGPVEGVYGFLLDEDRLAQADPSDGVSLIFNGATMRAGWSGGRTLAMDQLYVGNPAIPGSSAAGTAGDGAYHVAGASFAYSYTDAGGTVGDERGNLFGRNDAVRVRTGSGYHWNSAFGNETDVGVESGNEVNWKGGLKVVQWSTDATRGVIQDFAYGINNQVNGTAPGWRVGFALGGFEGWWPFTSDSTVMKALDGNIGGGPAKAFAAGIDFRGITVGESQFAGPGFMVDGSGDLGAVVASGVALQTRDGITAHTATVASITVLEGGLYSGAITLTLSAPQGSGTTATATVATVSIPYIENINAAGTGYAVGDTITLVGGTRSVTAVGTITKVAAGGGVQGIKMTTPGNYSVLPSSPIATTTSGAGTGLTITPKVSILTITVTGAGSNYLQFLPPTMTSAGASATYRQALVRVNMTATAAPLLLNDGLIAVTGMPTAVSGLSAGRVYNNSGALRVVPGASPAMRAINVLDFGADPTGATDSTTALQAALDAVHSAGGVVEVPSGTYLFSDTLNIKTKTTLRGLGTLKAAPVADWTGGTPYRGISNVNQAASSITDENIVIEGITIDYSNFGTGDGTEHPIRIRMARRVIIQDCRIVGGTSSVALLACDDTLEESNTYLNFLNCGSDHWDNPKNARLVGCHIETTSSAQMVNFNPENSAGTGTGHIADGFTMTGCTLVSTEATSTPCQLEPLATGNTVKNVTVSGNTFKGVWVVARGDVQGVTITANTFSDFQGNTSAIFCSTQFGGTPSGVTITGNVVRDPLTAAPLVAVIYSNSDSALISGNIVLGSGYSVSAVSVGSTNGTMIANYAPTSPSLGRISTGFRLLNGSNGIVGFTDTGGTSPRLYLQPDDNWVMISTDSAGADRNVFSIFTRSSSSELRFSVPTFFNGGYTRRAPATVSAAGTTISGATQLISDINNVSSCTAGVADGVMLFPVDGQMQVVVNTTAATLKVYPNNSGSAQIDNSGAGVAVTIAAGKAKIFTRVASGDFRTIAAT